MMHTLKGVSLVAVLASSMVFITTMFAQPGPPPGAGREPARAQDVGAYVTRMMTFDANQDGKLSKEEITDSRLLALFDRADANTDGTVTKEELTETFSKEAAALGNAGPGAGRGFPGGGPGGPGFGGPGGPGSGGPGGPPIGQVMPDFVREQLKLSNAQKRRLDALQKTVDARLAEILNDEQKQQLAEMGSRGPEGPGRPGPGGPPPGGPRRPGNNRDRGPGGPPGNDGPGPGPQ